MIEIMSHRPFCLDNGNSNRLESLLSMLRFQGSSFVRASSLIGQLHTQVQNSVIPSQASWDMVIAGLVDLRKECRVLQLDATLAQLKRVENTIGEGHLSLPNLAAAILEISTRMMDELDARYLYGVDSSRAAYIKSNQFSSSVAERFPEAIDDMNEAGKCFAFERPTACIFHLMRITEVGLNAFATLLEIPDHNPTWEPIIRKIDSELKADYKDRKYKGNQDFLANASTHLHAVKVAWRNPTMHVDKVNTMEHAKEIYDATCGFMRYLAENFPQKKPGIVQVIRGKLGV